jgi:hypoxanthine-DNA glycosylase
VLVYHTFEPVYRHDSKVLVLGTMPSPASRKYNFYYSHPQNRFWRVLAAVFQTLVPESRDDKMKFVFSKKIALWDVLASCEITGASDCSIKMPTANDLSFILRKTNINSIFCTGKKAFVLYNKLCKKQTNIDALSLPSTSPANCRISFSDLTAIYRAAFVSCLKRGVRFSGLGEYTNRAYTCR